MHGGTKTSLQALGNGLAVEVAPDQMWPLSERQTRIWFLDQFHAQAGNTPRYVVCRLNGAVVEHYLERSVAAMLRRHPILTARFCVDAGKPQCIVGNDPARQPAFTVTDLRDLPPSDRTVRCQEFLNSAALPFATLSTQPLVHLQWVRCTDVQNYLILRSHAIVADAASLRLLLQELASDYTAQHAASGTFVPRTDGSRYLDYVQWERSWLTSDTASKQKQFWQQNLRAPLPTLQLPTDQPRPPQLTFSAGSVPIAIPASVTKGLGALAERECIPLANIAMTAIAVMLYRYTAQTDLIIGLVVPGRAAPCTGNMVGPFSTHLPIRIQFDGNPDARALLHRVHAACTDAEANGTLPLEQIIDVVAPPRDQSRAPLFQVVLDCQSPAAELALTPQLYLQPHSVTTGTEGFDLVVRLWPAEDGLMGHIDYNSDLFSPATAARLAQHYQTLLAGLSANPDTLLSELPLLPPAELHQLLQDWNQSSAEYPQQTCSHELFEAQVLRSPDVVAVQAGTDNLSYAELNARANQLARQLRSMGIGADDVVGICHERSANMVVGLLGILKAGAAYLPLEPTYPVDRLTYMLDHAQPRAIVTQEKYADQLPGTRTRICLDKDWPSVAAHDTANLTNIAGPLNLVYVIYTSGSTGKPKGVAITQRGLTNYLWWAIHEYAAAAGCGSPVHSPLSFDLTVTSLWTPLLTGRKAVLIPDAEGEDGLINCLRTERNLSLVKLTPAHVTLLSQVLPAEDVAGRANALVIGGEALRGEMLTFWCRHAPKTRLINEYGPTETVVGCCIYEVPEGDFPTGDILIGRPNANCQLYVLDRHFNPTPVGVPGELYIGGTGLARGYLHRPDLTAERFVPNPFAATAGERLYKTGDLARYRPDGNLEYLGRVDHQVKVRGFRIELGEIEARLLEHPDVTEAVAIVRDDLPGGRQLVAYTAPAHATDEALRAHLRERLPEYMLPSIFVTLDTLPLNSNGKVERKALPKPDLASQALDRYVPPQTAVEQKLSELWQQILELPRVGRVDNFFQSGGHSLLAVRLVAAIGAEFDITLPLAAIFQAPTIGELATIIEAQGWTSPWYSVVPIQTAGHRPILFAVHTLSLKDLPKHLGADQPLYFLRYGMAGTVTDKPVALPSLVDLARHYIAEMRKLQPEGPYYLIGASFGGLVAYEMARQLRAERCPIGLLAMFDTHLTNDKQRLPLHRICSNLLRQDPQELLGRFRRKLAAKVTKNKYGRDYWPHIYTSAPDAALAAEYTPLPYDGDVTLFKAEQGWNSIIFQHAPPEQAWQPLIGGQLEIHVVPGDHIGIIEEPHVRDLVVALRRRMDKVITHPPG